MVLADRILAVTLVGIGENGYGITMFLGVLVVYILGQSAVMGQTKTVGVFNILMVFISALQYAISFWNYGFYLNYVVILEFVFLIFMLFIGISMLADSRIKAYSMRIKEMRNEITLKCSGLS